jgi:hypothetical protein
MRFKFSVHHDHRIQIAWTVFWNARVKTLDNGSKIKSMDFTAPALGHYLFNRSSLGIIYIKSISQTI